MKISVIMASYLGDYPNAAKDRVDKFKRAVASVFAQSYEDWELIIVADGCKITSQIYGELTESILTHKPPLSVKLLYIPRHSDDSYFGGAARNFGIEEATGDIICYLDTDDALGTDALDTLAKGFSKDCDWVYYDDVVVEDVLFTRFRVRCNVLEYGRIGTSGIAHKRDLPVQWQDGYGHDWKFIEQLISVGKDYKKLRDVVHYIVCHIPGQTDF